MSVTDLDPYQDIRPYHDDEVPGVLAGLLKNAEFVSALGQFRFPRLSRFAPSLVNQLVRFALGRQLAGVRTVAGMQDVIAAYMGKMIERTTHRVTFSGLEGLDANKAYLFISNHRDIAMDPAFVNWGLYHHGMQTVRIAIGDNLLKKPYVSDLMRLNKSFIVKRSVKGREKLKALMELSGYISHSIDSGHSIWIAQREGRAKDGNDFTDPAIIKMFYMGKKKSTPDFAEAVRELNIVPVSIAYQYDPCDALKARELQALASEGAYEKGQYEDIESIAQGITGFKGDVHVAFGQPMSGDYETPEALAEAIDREIIGNYHLHASNRVAADEAEAVDDADRKAFEERLQRVSAECRPWLKAMYANPALNKQKLA
ncbi:1-acyl-sn-glycerol-3-phosphate acyltransferase [Motiliproteus sp. SC1-56]|uniref:1-acyl-sn-glycerol-3-phosphate acyltransferase n=1 Tax=Motiliproteus sp. SC1-56 TaxID=2799565 RepID=UPI001A8D7562|nr:1-acyl-sn-glycerol-3-phosphate acyltransferase [Motiliproteus sp. SC1-56]